MDHRCRVITAHARAAARAWQRTDHRAVTPRSPGGAASSLFLMMKVKERMLNRVYFGWRKEHLILSMYELFVTKLCYNKFSSISCKMFILVADFGGGHSESTGRCRQVDEDGEETSIVWGTELRVTAEAEEGCVRPISPVRQSSCLSYTVTV